MWCGVKFCVAGGAVHGGEEGAFRWASFASSLIACFQIPSLML
jgi:hypothetical protein